VACWADCIESEAAQNSPPEHDPNDLVHCTTARSSNVPGDHERVTERCIGSTLAGRVLAGSVIWVLKEALLQTFLSSNALLTDLCLSDRGKERSVEDSYSVEYLVPNRSTAEEALQCFHTT
jgi:hypothetical protein